MNTYTISRFEEQGNSLFICINSNNNSVYLEHYFTEEEKLDTKGTITKLVAELELMDEAYVAPLPRISRLEEVKNLEIKPEEIAEAKTNIMAERIALENAKIEELPEEVIK